MTLHIHKKKKTGKGSAIEQGNMRAPERPKCCGVADRNTGSHFALWKPGKLQPKGALD